MINKEIEPKIFERLIDSANLSSYKNKCEFWDINGSSQKLAYLTHNYFRYFGKFPSTVAKKLIEVYSTEDNDIIVDTMVGSGTTLVEAALANKKAIGFDINPFSILLSKVKTTKISIKKLDSQFEEMKSKFRKFEKKNLNELIPEMRNIDHWFDKKVQKELAEIKSLIFDIKEKNIKEFFMVTFAAILRRASCAGSQTGRIFHDKNWKYKDPYELFEKHYNLMRSRMEELNNLSFPEIDARISNAKSVNLEDNSSNLVICHPPYYNLYKFSHTNKFELLWLDFDTKKVTTSEIFEGFKLGSIEKHTKYLDDMYEIIDEMHRIMAKNGTGALMLGDSIVQKQRVIIAERIANYLDKKNIPIKRIILRKPRFAEASYAAAQRRDGENLGHDLTDFIMVFGK